MIVFSVTILCMLCWSTHSFKAHAVEPLHKYRNYKILNKISKLTSNQPTSNMKLSLNSSPFLSLDKIVIPQHDRATLFKIGLLFIVWSITTFFLSVIRGQKNALAVVLTAAFEKVRELFQFKSDTRIPTSQVDLKSWQSIPLSKIKDLNEDYAMLQFDLPNKSLFDFGIDIGQELQACFLDDSGKALVGTIMPVALDDSKNKFFCILKKYDEQRYSAFDEALNKLNLGDEIAVKSGRRQLSQAAKYCDPIKYITLVSSSLGIAPSLSLMHSVRDSSSAVEGLTMIWMNKETDDFILDDMVMNLENQSNGKISVNRFINNNMDDREILYTEDIAKLILRYQQGRVIILCGSQSFTNVMKNAFTEYGYSKENVLTINTE